MFYNSKNNIETLVLRETYKWPKATVFFNGITHEWSQQPITMEFHKGRGQPVVSNCTERENQVSLENSENTSQK